MLEQGVGDSDILFKITRKGSFNILTTGENHCGTQDNITIKYKLVVECENSLDNRGFLFDQLNVQKHFETKKQTNLSCELFAHSSLEELISLIKKENDGLILRSVNLTISPNPHLASINVFKLFPKQIDELDYIEEPVDSGKQTNQDVDGGYVVTEQIKHRVNDVFETTDYSIVGMVVDSIDKQSMVYHMPVRNQRGELFGKVVAITHSYPKNILLIQVS